MKIIKQNKLRKPIQLLVGRPKETAAREANAGVAQTWRSPGLAPTLGSATDVRDRLNGGGGRGDHGEALGERGNTFLLRRVSKARAKVRPAMADDCGLALHAGKAKEGQME